MSSGVTRKRSESEGESVAKRPRLAPCGDEFLKLLDLDGIQDDRQLQERSREIAHALLHSQVRFQHKDTVTIYELLEVEFYWNNHSWHPDPFCHTGPRSFCEWHFHKTPRRSAKQELNFAKSETAAGGYRGGTRKGLDLSLGPRNHPDVLAQGSKPLHHGGFLLRSMRRVDDGVVISGPSLLVDEILRVFGASSLNHLISTIWNNGLLAYEQPSADAGQTSRMVLVPNAIGNSDNLFYMSPRVGLDLSNPETVPVVTNNRVTYVGRQYRYFRNPELLLANGRLQTFVGLFRHAKQRASTEASIASIVATSGKFSVKTVEKYITEFRRGQNTGKLQNFVGLAGKNSGPAVYLQLMGTLLHLDLL